MKLQRMLASKDANPKVRYCWGGAAAAKRPKAETNWNSNAKWKRWTDQDCPSTVVSGDNGWTSQNDQSPNLPTRTTCCIPSTTPEVVEVYALEGQSDCSLGNREYCTAVTRFNVPWRQCTLTMDTRTYRRPLTFSNEIFGVKQKQTTADNHLNCEWLPQNHKRNRLTAIHRKGNGSGLVLPSWAKLRYKWDVLTRN